MALLPKGEAEKRYKEKRGAFVQLTPKSLKNVDQLTKALDMTRKLGYATDDEETTLGVICFAVAASGFRGDTTNVAVSVTVLKQRLTPEFKQALLADLFALAKNLSNPLALR